MKPVREDKPVWRAVPRAVRAEAERILVARVRRAVRAYGGYGPSATFMLYLADGRRAFFKGIYPLPEDSAVHWMLDEEERVYRELAGFIAPWAPAFFGSLREQGWHALVIEAVAGEKPPPWTTSQAQRAMRSYAQFHAATVGRTLPGWLPRDHHLEFSTYWRAILEDPEATERVVAACTVPDHRVQARRWLQKHIGVLVSWEARLAAAPEQNSALLHFDTRSDNVRLDGDTLRIFDWPFACMGPPEFDLGAFAQSVAGEGGPAPEQSVGWYTDVLALDEDVLTASVAGFAGYFADRGSRPDVPGLPRLRLHQRRQLRSSLAWAARRLGLPNPDWLASVAD